MQAWHLAEVSPASPHVLGVRLHLALSEDAAAVSLSGTLQPAHGALASCYEPSLPPASETAYRHPQNPCTSGKGVLAAIHPLASGAEWVLPLTQVSVDAAQNHCYLTVGLQDPTFPYQLLPALLIPGSASTRHQYACLRLNRSIAPSCGSFGVSLSSSALLHTVMAAGDQRELAGTESS